MKELVVVAIGGNSIIKDNASQSIEHQGGGGESRGRYGAGNAGFRLRHCADPRQRAAGRAGLRRAEIAHEREGLPLTPLANCVADTQGGIGYLIQQALNNRLARHGEKKAVTVVTQVEVDKKRSGFCPSHQAHRRIL